MDKVKPIILKDAVDGKEYTLEFSRASIVYAERKGFNINELGAFPMTRIPEFFWYAFRMHHPEVTKQQAEKILERMGGLRDDVADRLVDLYSAPFETLTGDEEDSKNPQVEVLL